MKILGLCGGSGSGKGEVSEAFLTFSVPSIDTDKVYHDMTSADSPCLRELAAEFGNEIISPCGALDREALRNIVFFDREKLALLNEITHKHILAKTRLILSEYEASGEKLAVVDAPLLFESGFDAECDVTACVIADREVRISRIMQRDSIKRADAVRRIDSQRKDSELIALCDFCIENNGSKDMLRDKVEELITKII